MDNLFPLVATDSVQILNTSCAVLVYACNQFLFSEFIAEGMAYGGQFFPGRAVLYRLLVVITE